MSRGPVEIVARHGDLVDAVIHLHVQPGARRTEIVGPHGGALKIRVSAPARDGRANAMCLEFLAATLDVALRRLVLEAGASVRAKRVRATGVPFDRLRRLGGEPRT